ncbi:MAG: tetratricopeptide repeat protein [Verrucomicrobiales bacterium]|nr:tetratricopeptide repeat protein [Verrucomicrobiales bacterium]
MRGSVKQLYEELEKVPEDWSIRLRLIEHAIETGDREEAKRLVRSSPEDFPLPEELKARVYELMTRHWSPDLP